MRLKIQKIQESVTKKLEAKANHQKRWSNHISIYELFASTKGALNEEQNDERAAVIAKIDSDQFTDDAVEFKNSLSQSRHREMLTDYSVSELSQMRLFKVNGYNIGYALKKMENGAYDIVAVHNNEPDVKGVGEPLMASAIKNGGCFLDHYDTPALDNLYSKMGFTEINRDEYNGDYDEGGVLKDKHGAVAVVYRVHNTCAARFPPQ